MDAITFQRKYHKSACTVEYFAQFSQTQANAEANVDVNMNIIHMAQNALSSFQFALADERNHDLSHSKLHLLYTHKHIHSMKNKFP